MKGELYQLALSVPWLMEPLALEAMLSIAAREPLPEDEIARRMHGDKALALRPSERRDDSRRMAMRDGVAVIPIDGPIYRYADFFTNVSGGITTEALARDFGIARDDPAVRAILFRINSPGGEVVGINELAEKIYEARGVKPIVAYVEGIGASAAYWIASAADAVYLDDTARVGSIGTVISVSDPTKQAARTIEFVSSQSPKKRANPTTDDGRAYYQSLADATTGVFLEKVARNMGIEIAAILAVEGGLLTGQQAVAAGLAHALGSEEGTIRELLSGGWDMRRKRKVFPMQGALARAQQEVGLMSKVFSREWWGELFAGAAVAEQGQLATATAGSQLVNLSAVTPEQASAELGQWARIASTAAQIGASSGSTPPTQPDPEVARLRAELTKLRAEQIQKDAQAFAAAELAAKHALPAETEAIVALYVRAAEVDAASPRDDGQPSCVALVKAAYSNRPAHSLSTPLVEGANKSATVLPAADNTEAAELAAADKSARDYAEKRNGTGKK